MARRGGTSAYNWIVRLSSKTADLQATEGGKTSEGFDRGTIYWMSFG